MLHRYRASLRRYQSHLGQVARYQLGNGALSPIRFVIFGRGRSGSTALVSLLDSHPEVTCDGEILNQRVLFPHQHVLACCAGAQARVYGCKILSYQIADVQPFRDRDGFVRTLHEDGFKIIYLKRDNLIYHALSNIRARTFGFHGRKGEGGTAAHRKLEVDVGQLMQWIKSSEQLDAYEAKLLAGVPHLPLTYERALADAADHPTTLRAVCAFLGIDYLPGETAYRKVSPALLRDSVSNYDELVAALTDTPYARFLD